MKKIDKNPFPKTVSCPGLELWRKTRLTHATRWALRVTMGLGSFVFFFFFAFSFQEITHIGQEIVVNTINVRIKSLLLIIIIISTFTTCTAPAERLALPVHTSDDNIHNRCMSVASVISGEGDGELIKITHHTWVSFIIEWWRNLKFSSHRRVRRSRLWGWGTPDTRTTQLNKQFLKFRIGHFPSSIDHHAYRTGNGWNNETNCTFSSVECLAVAVGQRYGLYCEREISNSKCMHIHNSLCCTIFTRFRFVFLFSVLHMPRHAPCIGHAIALAIALKTDICNLHGTFIRRARQLPLDDV